VLIATSPVSCGYRCLQPFELQGKIVLHCQTRTNVVIGCGRDACRRVARKGEFHTVRVVGLIELAIRSGRSVANWNGDFCGSC
jgi:hypothetical protein